METIELLKRLIPTRPTAAEGELGAARVVADYFEANGLACQLDIWDEKRANVTVRVASTGSRPALLLAAHLDVVPPGEATWQYPPFEATEVDGKIYGRGTADMKGGLAAAASAIVETVKSGTALQGDIIFTAVAGEETDSSGVVRFVEQHRDELGGKLAGIVICEPTQFDIITAHRGILWLRITTVGKTAHGSMPHLGVNAILKMNDLLNRLRDFEIPHTPDPLLGGYSMSINRIEGGKATNVIPDRCTIEVDIRTLPGQDYKAITAEFEKLLAQMKAADPGFEANISSLRSANGLRTDSTCPFVRSLLDVTGIDKTVSVGFTTDGPHFVPLRAPIVIFGPGAPAVCHQPDEYIEIAAVEQARLHYRRIIERFLA